MSLSPGKHHERVPRGAAANYRWRKEALLLTAEEPWRRAAVRQACAEDILFYVNAFVWQRNPNKVGEEVAPFVTWDVQDGAFHELLAAVENREDALGEKSRDMGFSWLCLILFEWLWHFHREKDLLVVSRTADAVDSASDPTCLFWKIDFIHRHLPAWLMPAGWNPRKHRSTLKFENPETGSFINGDASTSKAFVGGRGTAIFVDEFSQIQADRALYGRTADVSKCRIFVGTHVGPGTKFAELAERPGLKKVRLHWTHHPDKRAGMYRRHPEKNEVEILDTAYAFPPDYKFVLDGSPAGGFAPGVRSPWYDAECVRRGSTRDVAMDLDIDVKGSTSQFFDPLLIRSLVSKYARPPVWQGLLRHDGAGQAEALEPDDSGPLLLWRRLTIDGRPPKARYAAGADCAAGTGATPSCLTVVDADTGEKVAEYADPYVKPEEFAAMCVALLRWFCDPQGVSAKLAWEMQGPGVHFSGEVARLGFFHFHRRRNEFSLAKKENADAPGWYPSPAAKRKLMEEYRSALKARTFENPSEIALLQTLDFEYTRDGVEHGGIENDDDPSGARVNHGDRVVADALAWMMALDVAGPRSLKKQEQPPFDPANPDYRTLAGRRTLDTRRENGDDWD